MDSKDWIAARDKVVNRACEYIGSRNAKNGATGAAKEIARSKQRDKERELAEAVEKFKQRD